MRSSPPRAARSRPSRGTAPPAPSSAPARPWRAARAHPVTDFQPFNYKVALRSEAIPVCVAWPNASPPPAPPTPLPAVPTLILSGGFDLRTPREDAAERRRADPGRPARRRALHRPLGRHQRPQRLRARTRSPPSSRASPAAQCPTVKQVIAPSPIAPTRLAKLHGRTTALKTVAAVTATVRDVRLQFLGDEIAAGRDDAGRRQGRRPALRPRDRDLARLQPAPRRVRPRRDGQRLRPGPARHRDADHQRPLGSARQADLPRQRHASRAAWAGARSPRRPRARRRR